MDNKYISYGFELMSFLVIREDLLKANNDILHKYYVRDQTNYDRCQALRNRKIIKNIDKDLKHLYN